jgi:hypothetical protein
MTALADFRKQYPQYDDMSDADLMASLHKKFYADMSREDFDRRMQSRTGDFAPGAKEGLSIPEPSMIEDVGKSAAAGVGRGVLGMAGLPGTIEQIGRAGINYGAKALGAQGDVVSPETALPTGADLQKRVEQYTGKFHEPQTTAGEYARTLGEFAPGLAFPGGAVQRVLGNVVGPAVASETAGQMTKGTAAEPWARVGGALVGAGLPGAISRGYTPVPTDPVRAAHVQRLRNEGVTDLTAGEVTGSTPLRYFESQSANIPFSGGRARVLSERAAEQFTQAALRRAGVNAPRATQEVIDEAFNAHGKRFDQLATASKAFLTRKDAQDISKAVDEYLVSVPGGLKIDLVEKLQQDIASLPVQRTSFRGVPFSGQPMSGETYQSWRSLIGKAQRGASSPQAAEALGDIMTVLDNAVERGLPQKLQGQWSKVRHEYRNLLAVSRAAGAAGENAANGFISPAQLAAATKAIQGRRNFERGRGDLQQLARSGEAVMSRLPDSGTASRMAAGALWSGVGQAVGALTGGPPTQAIGAILGPYAMGKGGQLLMSRPVQNYLGANARLAPLETNGLQGATNALATGVPSATNRLPLEVMIYPPGDPRN